MKKFHNFEIPQIQTGDIRLPKIVFDKKFWFKFQKIQKIEF